MAKYCPEMGRRVVYLDCLDCDTKTCKNHNDRYEYRNEKNKGNGDEYHRQVACGVNSWNGV